MSETHSHTHPNDCPDRKAAALDRKQHAAVMLRWQERRQALAHTEWFDWLPSTPAVNANARRKLA